MPKKKPEKTIVIFRRYPKKEGGEVIAIFPCVPATNNAYTCSCYVHMGQHGACDPIHVIMNTKPGKLNDPDVKALKRELEHYGPPDAHYHLDVRQRYSHRYLDDRRADLSKEVHQ